MPLDIYHLAQNCSKTVAPQTMVTLVKTESRNNPLAIGLNGARLKYQPRTESEAILWVRYLEEHKYNFDVGLAQINIKTIKQKKLKPEQLFNPCLNLRIAGEILTQNYRQAKKSTHDPQQALKKALSMYNTGNQYSGFHNGYINRILLNVDK